MDATIWTRFAAPPLESQDVRLGEHITVRPGVTFAAFLGAEADDPICRPLAKGTFPTSTYGTLVALLEALVPKGGRVLDLGTHVGTFMLTAAALGYEVIGVEASPRNASLLQASLDHNRFDWARLVHAAVSDTLGTLEFCHAGPYGHIAAQSGRDTSVLVRAVAVDDLLDEAGWDQADFIKTDIEGSEVAGLCGLARRLARPDAPPLFVESNGHTLAMLGESPETLKLVLYGFGYRIFQVEPGRLRSVRRDALQPITCVDYLAVKSAPRLERNHWRFDPPLTRTETVRRVVISARSDDPAERWYIARALAQAEPELLARRRVRKAVRSLCMDPDKAIRRAAEAVPLPPDWAARISRFFSATPLWDSAGIRNAATCARPHQSPRFATGSTGASPSEEGCDGPGRRLTSD
jgi:FkbM family methyltransferase